MVVAGVIGKLSLKFLDVVERVLTRLEAFLLDGEFEVVGFLGELGVFCSHVSKLCTSLVVLVLCCIESSIVSHLSNVLIGCLCHLLGEEGLSIRIHALSEILVSVGIVSPVEIENASVPQISSVRVKHAGNRLMEFGSHFSFFIGHLVVFVAFDGCFHGVIDSLVESHGVNSDLCTLSHLRVHLVLVHVGLLFCDRFECQSVEFVVGFRLFRR